MMEWFPIVFFAFKVLVLGTGMFFAVKWHYDKGKAEREKKQHDKTGGAQASAGNTLGAPD